jgi:hypothetical protein
MLTTFACLPYTFAGYPTLLLLGYPTQICRPALQRYRPVISGACPAVAVCVPYVLLTYPIRTC